MEHLAVVRAADLARIEDRFIAIDKAVEETKQTVKERFASVNEFRGALSDQQRTLMPRSETELAIKAQNEKIDALIAANIEKRGISSAWGYVVGAIGLVSTIITVIVLLVKGVS